MAKRVLVVDDEAAILMAFKKLLQSQKVIVDTAETLEDAMALIEEHVYDVVIADLRLTGACAEEGLEIIRHVRQRHPGTQTILLTAYGNQEVREKSRRLGTAFYFEKPVSGSLMKDTLRKCGVE
ncbi:MAG: response regulator [Nitrospirota bacterium]